MNRKQSIKHEKYGISAEQEVYFLKKRIERLEKGLSAHIRKVIEDERAGFNQVEIKKDIEWVKTQINSILLELVKNGIIKQ